MVSAPTREAPRILRDQVRAQTAYTCVAEIAGKPTAKAYKALVLDLGVNIRRMGLSAALAVIERDDGAGKLLVQDVQRALEPGRTPGDRDLPAKVRDLQLTEYMIATREILHFVVWLRRAAQALIKGG